MAENYLTNIQTNVILESGDTGNPLDEILKLTAEICPQLDCDILRKAHTDVSRIFSGTYPGFKENIAKYHNLRHTYCVVLASIRLFHGLFHEGKILPDRFILQGLLSAYFHDLGMLPQSDAEISTNRDYTSHHESRSIDILTHYLQDKGLPAGYSDNCAVIIHYTNIEEEAERIKTVDSQLELCGQVIGTADLLAQMADRYYLESLPLLFHEHQDSGIDKHTSALDLMRQTHDFHEHVIKKRLEKTLGNLAPAMKTHFVKRWSIDRNLYLENITLNLEYLKRITQDCSMDLSCWGKYLRRNPPEVT